MAENPAKIMFAPAGRCIYCGTTAGPLSTEHIIPFAINGRLELPKASCDSCAAITGATIEQKCLRQTLYFLRCVHGLRTRRPKNRAGRFELFVTTPAGRRHPILIPAADLPRCAWSLPKFSGLPTILGMPLSNINSWSIQVYVSEADTHRIFKKYSQGKGTSIETECGGIRVDYYCRMIAKISHAFGCALLGADGFEPLLTDFILKGEGELTEFVGADIAIPPGQLPGLSQSAPNLYRVALEERQAASGVTFVCARVRLFSFASTPGYVVVVGKSLGNKFAGIKNTAYELPVELAFPI